MHTWGVGIGACKEHHPPLVPFFAGPVGSYRIPPTPTAAQGRNEALARWPLGGGVGSPERGKERSRRQRRPAARGLDPPPEPRPHASADRPTCAAIRQESDGDRTGEDARAGPQLLTDRASTSMTLLSKQAAAFQVREEAAP